MNPLKDGRALLAVIGGGFHLISWVEGRNVGEHQPLSGWAPLAMPLAVFEGNPTFVCDLGRAAQLLECYDEKAKVVGLATLNKTMLIGDVVSDLTLKKSRDQGPFVRFKIETDTWVDSKKGDPEKHSCVIVGKKAIAFCKWVKKGDTVFLEGQNRPRENAHNVEVRRWQFCGEKQKQKGGRRG